MMTLNMKQLWATRKIDLRRLLKTQPATKVNGSLEQISDKVAVCKSGLTAQCMKVTGETTRLTEKVVSFTPMATSTSACGRRIKHTARASTVIWMALDILESGRRINSMDKESRHGQTVLVTMVSM